MADERVQRRLAAILAADMVGYSRFMHEDEAGTLARLKALRQELIEPKVAEFGGRIFKTTGDGFLIEFPSAVDAVQHAVDVQAEMVRRGADLPEDDRIELRIGITLGDVMLDGDDVYGDGVNVASRLEGIAEPGGIYVSLLVRESVRNKLDVAFDDLGERSVKNISDPVHVYRVALEPPVAGGGDAGASEAMFRRPAIAVLPFENLSGDTEQDYFTDGLTEDIITALSLWRTFPVIARNSTFAYKGQSPDIRKVGEELGARYVLEGSVRRAGDRVRVTAQMINTETGHHVWAERYDRNLEDIFDLQDELTQQIVATIAPELERVEHRLSAKNRSRNTDAWECCQRGMAHLAEFTAAGNIEGRKAFQQAIELDPDYAQAHAGLAYSHHRDLFLGVADSREQTLMAFFDAARRAAALDDSDSNAHWLLGLGYIYSKNWAQAITEGHRAIELNPSNAIAHILLGVALNRAGQPEEGILLLERGLRLSPNDPRNHIFLCFLADAHLSAGRFSEAMELARKAISNRPDYAESYVILASALGHLDQPTEANFALEECRRLGVDFTNLTTTWATFGRDEEGLEILYVGLHKAGLPE